MPTVLAAYEPSGYQQGALQWTDETATSARVQSHADDTDGSPVKSLPSIITLITTIRNR